MAGSRQDGLLGTQEFCDLLFRASRAPLIRRELTGADVPAGYDADEVWDALTQVRRAQAVVAPETTRPRAREASYIGWHAMPASLVWAVSQIEAHARAGSLLDQLALERSGRRFVTQQYVEEALTNLRLDAFPSDYESVRAALLGEAPPADDAQRLARNFHLIMNDMADYAGSPFDAGLLLELYGRLTEGVSATPPMREQHSPLEPFYQLGDDDLAEPDEAVLAAVVDIANDRAAEPTESPVMVSMLVNCQFWHDPAFPRCNNLMGCVASRLYLYRHGFPVFRYIPKIYLIWAWGADAVKSPRGYALEESHEPDGRNGVDWTAYYDTLLALMLDNILQIERSLGIRKAANDEVLAAIDGLAGLNGRQREVLRRALLDAGREFRIAWHKEKFNVVYSTARADLERLADLGLLTRAMAGAAYVYRPAPDLAERVMRARRGAGSAAAGREERRP